jgi:hypothetical protein
MTLNREGWLAKAIDLLRPTFNEAAYPLPDKVHISVGFPSKRALSSKNRVVGQCWSSVSPDGMPHIFISPVLVTHVEVLAVLIHELIHAYGIHDHKKDFAAAHAKFGLVGKPTQSDPGPELVGRLNILAEQLGPYPHPSFDIVKMEQERKKQTTRLLKAECAGPLEDGDDRYIIRVTKVHLDKHGPPYCPCHLKKMVVEGYVPKEDDEEAAA